jgi:hypothetical protein
MFLLVPPKYVEYITDSRPPKRRKPKVVRR